jgi:outer membrane protein OmpA-like peptidoglycan-associated protein
MNSWTKQRKACLISLALAFALAACDSEPEQKSDTAAPPDSITESQKAPEQPPQEQAAVNPPADTTTAPITEPEIVEGTSGEEPAAGGESIPPDESQEPEQTVAQDTERNTAQDTVEATAAPPPPPQSAPEPSAAEAPRPATVAPPPAKPQTAHVPKEATPPRKPEKPAVAKTEKPARPPARKPDAIPVNLPAGHIGGSIQQAVAMAPAERLPSDPSVVPAQARMTGANPDLSQMQFKIQEIHFNPGSANLTPGGERKTLTASRFISDLQLRSVKVVGYADTVGPTAFNQELALARAGSVASLLERAGVPADLIETVGMGEAKMPMPTDDGISEPLNRCVGILVSVDEVR